MKQNKGVTIRYSLSFKQKVKSEIVSGKLTAVGARKLYGIGGGQTIQKWMKKFGKLHLLNKIVRVELKDEVSRLKQLEKENKDLESALALTSVQNKLFKLYISSLPAFLLKDQKKSLAKEIRGGGLPLVKYCRNSFPHCNKTTNSN